MTEVSDSSTSSPARWSSPFDLRSTKPSPLPPGAFGGGNHSSESTIVTAAAAADADAAAFAPVGTGGSSLRPDEQAAESRVARPARRRTRSSRKAPVTLLNTDTTNFRAMVQQFTGFPAAAQPPPPLQYASSYGLRPGFGLNCNRSPPLQPPLSHFLQRPQYLEQQHQFPETAMFGFYQSNNNNGGGGGGQTEAFLYNSAGMSSGNLETMADAAAGHDVFLFGGQPPERLREVCIPWAIDK